MQQNAHWVFHLIYFYVPTQVRMRIKYKNMKKRSERRKHCTLPMQAGSVLHLCTKFKADCSISSKAIKGC